MRILLVEDDDDLATWLSQALSQSGFIVDWEEDGILAERRVRDDEFDAVVLDLGLPSRDGAEVLSRLRATGAKVPILIMTARDSLMERVGLLREGADDFLAKPFAIEELEARLIALVRRSHGHARGVFSCGALVYDQTAQRFTLGDDMLQLSPREHAVLRTLIARVGEPISKQQILDRLVGADSDLQLEAIEVIIHRLRRKLGEGAVQIVTLRGLGYFLEDAEAAHG